MDRELTNNVLEGTARAGEAGRRRGGARRARLPGRLNRRGGAARLGGEDGIIHLLRGGLGRRRLEGDGGGHGGHGARLGLGFPAGGGGESAGRGAGASPHPPGGGQVRGVAAGTATAAWRHWRHAQATVATGMTKFF